MMYINELRTQMSRQWMYNANRCSMEFIDGVHELKEAAKKHKYGGFIHCPCKFCKNEKDYSSWRIIHSHLLNSGFIPNYYVWTKHWERGIMLDNNEEEEHKIPDFVANYGAFFKDTAMSESEEDTEGHIVEDDLGQMLCEAEEVAKHKRNREIWSICWWTTKHWCTQIANKATKSWVQYWNCCNGRHQMVCLTRDSRSCSNL